MNRVAEIENSTWDRQDDVHLERILLYGMNDDNKVELAVDSAGKLQLTV